VLEPEQHQGQTRAAQLVVDVLPVGHRPDQDRRRRHHEKSGFQHRVIQLLGLRPVQTGLLGPLDSITPYSTSPGSGNRLRSDSETMVGTALPFAADALSDLAESALVFRCLSAEALPVGARRSGRQSFVSWLEEPTWGWRGRAARTKR
jgi:hypothetical protein